MIDEGGKSGDGVCSRHESAVVLFDLGERCRRLRREIRRNIIRVFASNVGSDFIELYVIAPDPAALATFIQLDLFVFTERVWKELATIVGTFALAGFDRGTLFAWLYELVETFQAFVIYAAELAQLASIEPDSSGLGAHIESDSFVLDRLQR